MTCALTARHICIYGWTKNTWMNSYLTRSVHWRTLSQTLGGRGVLGSPSHSAHAIVQGFSREFVSRGCVVIINLCMFQGSRLDDQRCAPPTAPGRGPTVPDEDFFSLIIRSQAKRIDEQRVTPPSLRWKAKASGDLFFYRRAVVVVVVQSPNEMTSKRSLSYKLHVAHCWPLKTLNITFVPCSRTTEHNLHNVQNRSSYFTICVCVLVFIVCVCVCLLYEQKRWTSVLLLFICLSYYSQEKMMYLLLTVLFFCFFLPVP